MTRDTSEPEQSTAPTAELASAVMRVSELDRSVNFYSDVFLCRVAVRDGNTALLLTPGGFQIYLHSKGRSGHTGVGNVGVQCLRWATDSEAELWRVTQRLRVHDLATYSHTKNGVTFVEGCDPDEIRVIVAYPSPSQLPRELIVSRFQA